MPIIVAGNQVSSSAQISPDVVLTGNIKDGEIVNNDIAAAAAIAWTKISKVGSSIADLATKVFTDISGILGVTQGGTGLATLEAHKLYVGNGTGTPTAIATGTDGQFLKSQGASADPVFANSSVAAAFRLTASATVRTSSDAAASCVNEAAYIKLKEFLLNDSPGVVRVTMTLRVVGNASGTNSTYGKVYINGVAAGAEHVITNGGDYSQTFTDDVTVVTGDLIQVYGHEGASGGGDPSVVTIRDVRLEYDKTTIAVETNTVNL